jgi:DNA-binding GntR family transcriptional regulator
LLSFAFAVQRQSPELLRLHEAAITWREHLRIVRALARHDAETTERLVREHVGRGRAYVVRSLRAQGGHA